MEELGLVGLDLGGESGAPDFMKGDKEGWLWMWGQEEVVEVREGRSLAQEEAGGENGIEARSI